MLGNLIVETANAPGSAQGIDLVGPLDGRASFASQFSNGSSVFYFMSDGSQAESGIGTLTHGSPNRLDRTAVLWNSAGTLARLNFASTTRVYNAIPASRAVYIDNNGRLVADAGAVAQPMWGGTAAGAANALTVTLTPAPTQYRNGMRLLVIAAAANTGPLTINVNGLGTVPVYRADGGTQFIDGEVQAGALLDLVYSGAAFRAVNAPVWQRASRFLVDQHFYMTLSGADAALNWDADDYDAYDRVNNVRRFFINGAQVLNLADGQATFSKNVVINKTSPHLHIASTSGGADLVLSSPLKQFNVSSHADGYFLVWDATASASRMVIDGDGTMTVPGRVSTPHLRGGIGDAGTLKCWNTDNTVCFRWLPGDLLAFRVDEANQLTVCTASNARGFAYTSPGGGPVGINLNGYDFGGTLFGIHVDSISDERMKENIGPTQVDALDVLRQIEVVEFDWKPEVSDFMERSFGSTMEDRHQRIGLIAQRLKTLVPEAVNVLMQPEGRHEAIPEDQHSINLQALVPYMIRALQQQDEEIEALRQRVAALEAAGAGGDA